MTESRLQPRTVRTLFASIAGRYDLANHLLSGGMDFFWRRRAATLVRSWNPTCILDLATGSGDLAVTLREFCPDSSIVGADFCLPMLREARRKGVPNLVTADALHLPFAAATFDALTVAFGLRNMESWPRALGEMARVLKPAGYLLVLDFSIPPRPLRWIYRPYLHHVLPHIASFLTGEKSAYDYLGSSIETFPSGDAMAALLKTAGFDETQLEPLTGGIVTIYSGRRTIQRPTRSQQAA